MTFRKFIPSLLIFSLLMSIFMIKMSYAQSVCKASEELYGKTQSAFPSLDIRRTINNMFGALATDVISFIMTNGNPQQVTTCIKYVAETFPSYQIPADSLEGCELDAEARSYCERLVNTYHSTKLGSNINQEPFSQSRVAGSLIGIAHTLNGATREPLPLNMAYFWNRSIENVPFMNTAMAQTVSYRAPFLEQVYGIWRFFRNVSYGILAIVLIVVGFMIMMRRRISQQAVVTVQYALPKIVMYLILITFSYPIGAFFASLGYSLFLNAALIIQNVVTESSGFSTASVEGSVWGLGTLVILVLSSILRAGGVAVSVLVLAFILLAVILVYWIFIALKTLNIYVKIILQTLFAPFIFAISAVPGSDDYTVKWFKQMFAYAISLPAMTATVALISIIATEIVIASFDTSSVQAWFGGAFISIIIVPLLLVMGYHTALQIPNKINDAIVGSPKKR